MVSNTAIPCPECDRVKYFVGFCYYCKNKHERECFEAMTEDEIKAMVDKIIAEIDGIDDWNDAYYDFKGLLAYQDINTAEIANAAFLKEIFSPPMLYRDASEEVQSQLIGLLLNPDCSSLDADKILQCLAFIGGDKVRNVFFEFENKPLPWQKKLYVSPSIYAEAAGWSFDEYGNKVELIYQDCYSLLNEEYSDDAVKVGELKDEFCSICHCEIVNILIIDGRDERLSFLG